jgi:hypothetical protein
MGRPSKREIALFALAAALIVGGLLVLHGSPEVTKTYPLGHGHTQVVSQPTHPVDIIRTVMAIAGVILALAAFYHWGTRGEAARTLNEDEERRRFGDSIMDARTNQDPRIGMTPVKTDDPRH